MNCDHDYVYNVNASPSEKCMCAHKYDSEKYPSCICPDYGAWVCSKCKDLQHVQLLKCCVGCGKGIDGVVRYSQHFHDACVPEEYKREPK